MDLNIHSCEVCSTTVAFESICIAIKNVKANQNHVGLLFNDPTENNEVRLLHFWWNNQLLKDTITSDYICLEIQGIDEIEKQHLITVFCMIYNANQHCMPYGVYADNDAMFDDNFRFDHDGYSGLTCVNFIIKIFERQKIHVIDFRQWNHEDSDTEWQNSIMTKVAKDVNVNCQYVEFQVKKIKSKVARVKPEELAAALAIEIGRPHARSVLSLPSKQIVKTLHDLKGK